MKQGMVAYSDATETETEGSLKPRGSGLLAAICKKFHAALENTNNMGAGICHPLVMPHIHQCILLTT